MRDATYAHSAQRAGWVVARLLVAVSIVLTVVSAIVLLLPGFDYLVVAPDADLIIDTAAVVLAAAVAGSAWIRYTQTGETDSLFQSAAFLTLFAGGALRTGLLLTGHDLYGPFERDAPGQAPLYIWTLQRLVGAVLLLLGGVSGLRRWRPSGRALSAGLLLGPALAVTLLGLVALVYDQLLPALIPTDALLHVIEPVSVPDASRIGAAMAVAQLAIGTIYLAAAAAYTRLAARGWHSAYTGVLAVALVVAAFTQLHYAVVPGSYNELLTSGDVLRLFFYVLVLLGVVAAARRDLADLATAHRNLAELRERDAERIALEERARLARDVHDGLVQELWLARLSHGRLMELADMPPDAQAIVTRVDAILEAALGEARQAVVALQANPESSFGGLLRRVVEDYADRFGLDVECTIDSEPPALPGRSASNLLRICREALNNVRKHADATVTRVNLKVADGTLTLAVEDNGKGFDPSRPGESGFGLRSMRERAELLGARLDIDSAPMDGTRVTLVMPLEAQAPAAP
jgi:signal transduction histidine kinase